MTSRGFQLLLPTSLLVGCQCSPALNPTDPDPAASSSSSWSSPAPPSSSATPARPLPPLVPLPVGYQPPAYQGPKVRRLSGHACVILDDLRVFCWIDMMAEGLESRLREVIAIRGADRVWKRSGRDGGCAMWPGGTLRCWGDDTYAQINAQPPCKATWVDDPAPPRDTPEFDEFVPRRRRTVHCGPGARSPLGDGASDILLDAFSTCAIKAGGVRCWGDVSTEHNVCPEESASDPPDSVTSVCRAPVTIRGFRDASRFLEGLGSSCVLAGDSVDCEGFLAGKTHWTAVRLWTGVRSAALGFDRACAVLTDGAIACTGGEPRPDQKVGDRAVAGWYADLPLVPKGWTLKATDIVGGLRDSYCALLTDTTVACWGDHYGPTPVAIPGVRDVEELSMSGDEACARTKEGAVYCWGIPFGDELGPHEPGVPVPPRPLVFPP